ncbi:MAG: hypothetical protein ACRDRP_25750 [Pseudonocardiaceae bacterium]
MRQGALTGFRCHHAGDTVLRPHCEGFATVAYGRVALCDNCDRMRSAVGREHAARRLPGADLDRLAQAVESLRQAERALAGAVRSARDGGASWGQIGDIVGTTRQAAHQRWSPGEGPTR